VNFPEPSRIEAKLVAEFDLRDKIPIALALRKPGRTRQLVEEPKRICPSLRPVVGLGPQRPDTTMRPWRHSRGALSPTEQD
jgi:hypothetical protein